MVLPIVPMFHAAAWGLPFAGALAGCKFVYSATNDAAVLCELMNREKVTHSAGVPTVWLAMFAHMDATGEAPGYLQQVTIGGSAAPRAMIARIMSMGVNVKHLWGMTETSPIGTAGTPPPHWDEMSAGREARSGQQAGPGAVRHRTARDRRRGPRTAARRREFGPAAGAAGRGC